MISVLFFHQHHAVIDYLIVCVCVCVCVCARAQSCPALCDPITVVSQGPLSVEFFRQEYWSGLPFPTPGDNLITGAL